MHVLVITSQHGYSIYNQSDDLESLKTQKEDCEKLQEQIPAADGSRCRFIIVQEGTVPLIKGESFLQSLVSFCPDFKCLEEKIQSV